MLTFLKDTCPQRHTPQMIMRRLVIVNQHTGMPKCPGNLHCYKNLLPDVGTLRVMAQVLIFWLKFGGVQMTNLVKSDYKADVSA